jgi:hypothetical protein
LQDAAEETAQPVGWGKFARLASLAADPDHDGEDATADTDDAAADADDADDATTDADDADDSDSSNDNNNSHYWRTHEMRAGLLLIQVPGRYWGVTRVGWARHVEGDEWELHGAVTLVRKSGSRKLSQLAEDGPQQDHSVSTPARLPERSIAGALAACWWQMSRRGPSTARSPRTCRDWASGLGRRLRLPDALAAYPQHHGENMNRLHAVSSGLAVPSRSRTT